MRLTEEDRGAAQAARARGMIYATLAWGWRYPDEETAGILGDLIGRCLTAESARFLDSNTKLAIQEASTAIALHSSEVSELRSSYSKLFGHAVRGSCPLYELEYGQSEIVQQAFELADIAGFYNAFGLECAEAMERVDHVAMECEFMSVLCAKQAAGFSARNVELVDICCDAQRAFLRDHLARWLPALESRVSKADGAGMYGKLAQLSTAFLDSECVAFGIEAGPEYLELRSVDPNADTEIQCGPAPAEHLIPLTVGGLEPSSGE